MGRGLEDVASSISALICLRIGRKFEVLLRTN
jgi:hypothetical protein